MVKSTIEATSGHAVDMIISECAKKGNNASYAVKEYFSEEQQNVEQDKQTLENIKIRNSKSWNGIFQPHVTIQMPLEKIVDVYNKLYSNLDTIGDTTTMHSLKMIDAEHKKIKNIIEQIGNNLRNECDIGIEKTKGLIFSSSIYDAKHVPYSGDARDGAFSVL